MSDRAIALAAPLVREYEGLRLSPYVCPAGLLTIGYGRVIRGDDGRPVNKATAAAMFSQPITREQAEAWLVEDLAAVARRVRGLVSVELTDPQFAALISFAFNVGVGAFRDSTLRKRLNRRDYLGVPVELRKWVRAGQTVLAGLVRRREAEALLWRQPA